MGGDFVLMCMALIVTLALRYPPSTKKIQLAQHAIPFLFIFLLWIFSFAAAGFYELRRMQRSRLFLYRLLRVMGINAILAVSFFYLFPAGIEPRRNLILVGLLTIFFVFLWRYIFNHIVVRVRTSRVLFLGVNKEVMDLTDFLATRPQLGYKPILFVTLNNTPDALFLSLPVIPLSSFDLIRIAREHIIDTIVLSGEAKENKQVGKLLLTSVPMGIPVFAFPAFHEMLTGKIPLSLIEAAWFLENLIGIRKRTYEFFKRVIDLILSALATIPALLTFPFIALAIKIDSDGPIFFRQIRVGRHDHHFALLKYRSMCKNAYKISGEKETDEDQRHTRVGTFLRKHYLDELPQIINIIKGEMSFVGPRPERPEYVTQLKNSIPFYEMRLLVSPGLTGWAQINMDDDASVADAPVKMQYDLYYIKNRAPMLDLLILLRTLATLLRRQGR